VTKLTIKQEKFCLAYMETGNASEAYRRAYNASGMKEATINVKASELLKNGKVAVRVRDLASAHAQRHEITIDSLTEMLKADRELARTEKKSADAIAAVMAIAKLHGMVVEKKNVDVNADHKHHHSAEPLSESAHWLARMLGGASDSEAPESLLH
jgi:phage terminase small subunit